ncbi:hypothetical protein BaRGS_00022093 [Batillaria attramentaria]|uniref:Uncharacterized protein n=1 Tax=Batillaria attramentaria TaxID=370345 RepID=A0ABD0KI25_9CAEN
MPGYVYYTVWGPRAMASVARGMVCSERVAGALYSTPRHCGYVEFRDKRLPCIPWVSGQTALLEKANLSADQSGLQLFTAPHQAICKRLTELID